MAPKIQQGDTNTTWQQKCKLAKQIQLGNTNSVVSCMQTSLKESPTQPVVSVAKLVKSLSLEDFSLPSFATKVGRNQQIFYSNQQFYLEII